MGVHHLSEITSQRIAHGRAPQTPAALIERGTARAQTVISGALADIVAGAGAVKPPVTFGVGEVVNLREPLTWFEPASIETGVTEPDFQPRPTLSPQPQLGFEIR